jgi:hypothetical protein
MKMKLFGLLVLLIVFGGFVLLRVPIDTTEKMATTTPTGSTTTPEVPSVDIDGTMTLALGQSGTRYGITVIPQSVKSDSRCPKDVQCVWAGKVEVETQIVSAMGTSTNVFEIGTTITTEAETVTLKEVIPYPSAGLKTDLSDYRFTFEVAKRTDL